MSAEITPGIGSVPVSGSRSVSPVSTTTYRITVRDASGRTGTATATVTVTEPPSDLVVTSHPVSVSTLRSGQSFQLPVSVRNQGTGRAAATTLRVYRSSDATISDGDTFVRTVRVTALSPSALTYMSIPLTAPSSAGTYYYGACVDPVSGESRTGNNCSSGVQVTVTDAVSAGKMYWTDYRTDKIQRANLGRERGGGSRHCRFGQPILPGPGPGRRQDVLDGRYDEQDPAGEPGRQRRGGPRHFRCELPTRPGPGPDRRQDVLDGPRDGQDPAGEPGWQRGGGPRHFRFATTKGLGPGPDRRQDVLDGLWDGQDPAGEPGRQRRGGPRHVRFERPTRPDPGPDRRPRCTGRTLGRARSSGRTWTAAPWRTSSRPV